MSQPGRWPNIAVEGAVIVVSILLAFAVDATWDARGERVELREGMAALSAEIGTNRDALMETIEFGERANEATIRLIESFGPNPPDLSTDSLAFLFVVSLSYGAAELETSAMTLLLSDVRAEDLDDSLYRRLIEFRAAASRQEDNGAIFERLRERVVDRLNVISPAAFIGGSVGIHGQTEFPMEVGRVLRDPELQGRLSSLAIRTNLLLAYNQIMLEAADSIQVSLGRTGVTGRAP